MLASILNKQAGITRKVFGGIINSNKKTNL